MSHHLKGLEDRLGHRLLERDRRRIRLTRAGRLVYDASKQILEQYRELEAALQHPSTEVSGLLRVAAVYTVGLYTLPTITTNFLKSYPQVDLQLRYLHAPDIYDMLLNQRVRQIPTTPNRTSPG